MHHLRMSLAAAGHHTIIAKMPVNLAVLKPNLADEILAAYPEEQFVMGGHSLGGSMAARYVAAHPDALHGIFFLASYPDEKGSVKSLGIPALSILGTKDEVVNATKYQIGRMYLPEDTVYYTIEGGNHAQFGDYGHQKGDGEPEVSGEEQIESDGQDGAGLVKYHQVGFDHSALRAVCIYSILDGGGTDGYASSEWSADPM